MKKTILLLFLTLANCLFSQAPTLIASGTYKANGSGTSGVPIVNINIPAGKNRLMLITTFTERIHSPVFASNYINAADGSSEDFAIPISVNGIAAQWLSGPWVTDVITTSTETIFSTQNTVRYISENMGLPTGNVSVTFPGINLPENAGDEMMVHIAVFENAKAIPSLLNWSNVRNFDTTNFLTLSGTAPAIPVGNTLSNITFFGTGAISQQKLVSFSTGWNNIQSDIINNTAGNSIYMANMSPNEHDGIGLTTAYSNITSGNPSFTLTRTATNPSTEAASANLIAILPLARPSVSGTVYVDNNGLTGGINSGGTGGGVWNTANTLYVNAIDNNGNVVATALVNTSGVFSFPAGGNLVEGNNIKFQLSKNQGTVGQPAPAKELPTNWSTVGESITSGPSDGNPNGEFSLIIGTTNSTNNTTYRFGVTICAAGTSQPIVSSTLTNTCPANFVNLDTAHTGITPSGVELVWFTNNTHSGTPLTSAQVSKAVTGIYYAYYYDYVKNCYSPASNAVTVNIITCCPVFTSFSNTGWSAKVFDAPAGTDAWTEISNSNNFPTSSYSQIATFNYNVKANTNEAFSIDFQTLGTGLTPSNPQIQNYIGTQINNDPSWPVGDPRINEDYAVLFSKTLVSGEEGTYQFDLTYGDDHVFIYKNGVKLNQMNDAYYGGPFIDFVTVYLAPGDVISVLMVEEYEFNTEVVIIGEKKVTVQNLSNSCPTTTVNLNDSLLTATPAGATVLWFNNNTHSGTALTAAQVANAGAGTYYAFYSNGSGCYSPASNAVTVTINSCVCYRDPVNNGSGTETKMGITLLKRAGSNDPGNWPMVRKSGHIALESNTQGFVVTRIAKADLGNITNPQEGMMVYDTTDKCLKIYSDNEWKCFSTPACPDESPILPVINPNNPPQT